MNGLTRPWDAFIQIVLKGRRNQSSTMYAECIQEGGRVANHDELLKDDDHAIATYARKGKGIPPFQRRGFKGSPKKAHHHSQGK